MSDDDSDFDNSIRLFQQLTNLCALNVLLLGARGLDLPSRVKLKLGVLHDQVKEAIVTMGETRADAITGILKHWPGTGAPRS